MTEQTRRVQVLDLIVDTGARTVQRGGETLRLSGLTFDFLVVMIDIAPNVASYDELIERVWKRQIVTPETIAQRASMLRRAIATKGNPDGYFDAVRGIGYRLTANVSQVPTENSTPLVVPRTAQTIAVLPFQDLSERGDQAFFCDGLVEDLIGAISRVPGLLVISRNASFALNDNDLTIAEIADRLNVDWLLTGSVRRAGHRIRTSVQLIETKTERAVLSQKFDGTTDEIFDLQDEVTLELVRSLDIKLVSGDVGRHRVSKYRTTEMSEAFYQGLYHFFRHDPQSMELAIEYFEDCVRIEPESVLGHAWQVTAWAFSILVGWKDPAIGMMKLKSAAEAALSLDPEDPQALVGLAYFTTFTGDPIKAIDAAQSAVRVAPNHEEAVFALAYAQMMSGDAEAAIVSVTRAMRLCPVVTATRFGILATCYRNAGRYAESIESFQACIQEFPEFVFAYSGLATAYGFAGDYVSAERAVKQALAIDPSYTVERFMTPNLYIDKSILNECAFILGKAGMPSAS